MCATLQARKVTVHSLWCEQAWKHPDLIWLHPMKVAQHISSIISTSHLIGLDEFTTCRKRTAEHLHPTDLEGHRWDGGRVSIFSAKLAWLGWLQGSRLSYVNFYDLRHFHFVVSCSGHCRDGLCHIAARSRTWKVAVTTNRIPSNTTWLTGKPSTRILFREKHF